ncbi:MAG: hypothetical protein DMG04_00765 [Acidobacteria bacterium]|nr:MAG: hypothetical protein DMG04_00765 [Acidobacteriota bacterium]
MTGRIAAGTSAIALVLAFAACGRREDSAGRQADTALATRRTQIIYEASDRPRGAEVRMRTTDAAAVAAIHAFLAFQRTAHHAAGHEAMPRGVH